MRRCVEHAGYRFSIVSSKFVRTTLNEAAYRVYDSGL
jgi:hypothetical protein